MSGKKDEGRKRIAEKREVITLDVRAPGSMSACAMDVMVAPWTTWIRGCL
jgi:hypothetical protein